MNKLFKFPIPEQNVRDFELELSSRRMWFYYYHSHERAHHIMIRHNRNAAETGIEFIIERSVDT